MRRFYFWGIGLIILILFLGCSRPFQSELQPPFFEKNSTIPGTSFNCPFLDSLSQNQPLNDSITWWQVYFTDPITHSNPKNYLGSIEEKLISAIQCSQVSIDIASYDFDLPHVADALLDAQKRGVKVRWITDLVNGLQVDAKGLRLFPKMVQGGIQVKSNQYQGLMHNKFWIFDRQMVWTGSTNITKSGIYSNNNNVVQIRSPRLADIYSQQFEDMWKDIIGPYAPSDLNQQFIIIDDTPIQVLFSPEDNTISSIIKTVKNAKKAIHFMAFTFTDKNLAELMLEKAQNGVSVSGIFETDGSEAESSQFKTLFCAGLPVKLDGNPSAFHHKVIVVDEHILITGSFNFTASANLFNSENTLIIDNPSIAQLFIQEFTKNWIIANQPDPQKINCR